MYKREPALDKKYINKINDLFRWVRKCLLTRKTYLNNTFFSGIVLFQKIQITRRIFHFSFVNYF